MYLHIIKSYETLIGRNLLLEGKLGMDGPAEEQTTRQKWRVSEVFVYTCDTENKEDTDEEDIINQEVNEKSDATDDEDKINREVSKNSNAKDKSDKAVFMVGFVPLRISNSNAIVLINKTPNSVNLCRPVMFEFAKENERLCLQIYKKYNKLIQNVIILCFDFKNIEFEFLLKLHCTMLDGKIVNFLTKQKASQACNTCRVTPKFII